MNKTNNMMNGYRWIILGIGVLAQITFSIGFAGVSVSGVIMREEYQFTLTQVGFVLGCMGLGVALSEIIWGILTDKWGDKIVLIAGLVLMGCTFLYMAFFCVPKNGTYPDYRYFGGLLVLAGAVGGSVNSSSGRAIMSWFMDNERGFATSIRQTAIPIGAAIGSVLFPYIASQNGFDAAFKTITGICFAVALVVAFGLKTVEKDFENSAKKIVYDGEKSPFKRLSVWKIALAGGFLTFPQMAIMTFASVYLTDVYSMKMISISMLISIVQLGGGVLRIVTGKLSDKYKNRCQLICLISVIAGVAGIALGIATNQNIYIVTILLGLTGLAGNAWHGIAYTEIAVVAGVRYSGRALGMIGTTVFTVSFVIPYIIPYILNVFSWSGVWVVVGIASLIALPLMNEFRRKKGVGINA